MAALCFTKGGGREEVGRIFIGGRDNYKLRDDYSPEASWERRRRRIIFCLVRAGGIITMETTDKRVAFIVAKKEANGINVKNSWPLATTAKLQSKTVYLPNSVIGSSISASRSSETEEVRRRRRSRRSAARRWWFQDGLWLFSVGRPISSYFYNGLFSLSLSRFFCI